MQSDVCFCENICNTGSVLYTRTYSSMFINAYVYKLWCIIMVQLWQYSADNDITIIEHNNIIIVLLLLFICIYCWAYFSSDYYLEDCHSYGSIWALIIYIFVPHLAIYIRITSTIEENATMLSKFNSAFSHRQSPHEHKAPTHGINCEYSWVEPIKSEKTPSNEAREHKLHSHLNFYQHWIINIIVIW